MRHYRKQTGQKILKSVSTIALMIVLFGCKAQNAKLSGAIKPSQAKDSIPGSFYNHKNLVFINKLQTIKYDSVKVFYFNQEKMSVADFSLKVDTPHIYNMINETPIEGKAGDMLVTGFATTDPGKKISRKDSRMLLRIFEDSFKDIYNNDPVSPYIPTCGFVFLKNGIATAHIDVAMNCGKVQIEVFETKFKHYHYEFGILGTKMYKLLSLLIKKYQLPSWVLTE